MAEEYDDIVEEDITEEDWPYIEPDETDNPTYSGGVNPYLQKYREFDVQAIVFKNMDVALRYRNVSVNKLVTRFSTASDKPYYGIIYSDDIENYSADTSLSDKGLCLGDVISGNYSLRIKKSVYESYLHRTYSELSAVVVLVKLGVYSSTSGKFIWQNFGMWYIDSVEADYYDSIADIRGVDALSRYGDVTTRDNGTYTSSTTWGDVYSRFAKYVYTGGSLENAPTRLYGFYSVEKPVYPTGVTIVNGRKRPWWELPNSGDTVDPTRTSTLRNVISTIAAYAGGYAYIDFSGVLTIKSFNGNTNKYGYTLTEDNIYSVEMDSSQVQYFFIGFDYVRSYSYSSSSGKYSNVVVSGHDESEFVDPEDCYDEQRIKIDRPYPIYIDYPESSDIESMLDSCGRLYGGTLDFVGDIGLTLGQVIKVNAKTTSSSSNTTIKMLASSIHYEFNGGFKCSVTSTLPSPQDAFKAYHERTAGTSIDVE